MIKGAGTKGYLISNRWNPYAGAWFADISQRGVDVKCGIRLRRGDQPLYDGIRALVSTECISDQITDDLNDVTIEYYAGCSRGQ